MLIGLTGYSGSGKDTAAGYLERQHGFERRAFADKLKELVYAQNPLVPPDSGHDYLRPLVDDIGWDAAKRGVPAVRRLLQDAGQAHRQVFGADFWVDQVLPSNLPVNRPAGDAWRRRNVVITDVRYPNEVDRVRYLGGRVVRVERPGVGPVNDHPSEAVLPCDMSITNDLGITEFHETLDNLIGVLS